MKKYNISTIMIFMLLLMIGCGKDKISYENPEEQQTDEYGYLTLPEVVYVDLSSENFNEIETTKASSNDEADDAYLVTITNSSNGTVEIDTTYGELKAMEEIALSPASYNISVRSTDDIPLLGSEPQFAVSKDFSIVSGLTTTIDDLSCTMSNIKVSVNFSADLLSLFMTDSQTDEENLNVALSIGDTSVNYRKADSGTINFFKAVETSNTLEMELTGMYNIAAENADPSYTMIEGWKQSITGVKAGQWRNISINVEHANAGNVDFEITIDTWTYDEQINVDITSSIYQVSIEEAELDDPENYITDDNAPVVTQGTIGTSIDKVFYVDQDSFSLNSSLQAICIDPLVLCATPSGEATITEVWIEFTSNNASMNSWFESKLGVKRREYILSSSESSTALFSVSGNYYEASYSLMYQLYLYDGIHQATIMAKDSEGRCSYSTIIIISSNEGIESVPPTIEWRGGISFDDTHIVDPVDGLEVIIDITSETGITGFTLEINSEVLTPDELTGINLAQEMDLINPGDCKGGLEFLGFPIEDQVEGQTELVFDISSFMPQLLTLGSGSSDFVLNVTDAGGTTTKTLHIKVE